jgi:hypothetical protein
MNKKAIVTLSEIVSHKVSRNRHSTLEAWTIERFLHWAYQEQAADAVLARAGGHALGFGNNIGSVMHAGEMGALIMGGMGGGSLPLHPDAEVVHEASRRMPLVVRHASRLDARCRAHAGARAT